MKPTHKPTCKVSKPRTRIVREGNFAAQYCEECGARLGFARTTGYGYADNGLCAPVTRFIKEPGVLVLE